MDPARALPPVRAARCLRTALLVTQLEIARRLQGALGVATAVVFLLWVRRAQHGLRLLGVERLGFSPRAGRRRVSRPSDQPRRSRAGGESSGTPVGAGTPRAARGGRRAPVLVAVWWALVVVAAVGDPVWRQLAGSVESLVIGGSTLLFIVVQLANLAAALLAIVIVWTIDAQQARQFEMLEG